MRTTVVILILILALLGACAGEMAQPPDGGGVVPTNETWSWPDTSPLPDSAPRVTPDSYAGAPFGCQQDSDCFGLRCCETPWGVKLCAADCP